MQPALTGTWMMWVLNHLYLAAQLVVLPGALVFLYRRSQPIYERLRNTILATWLISIPVYARVPRRAAAARGHRHGRHDQHADGGRDGLDR